MKWIWILTLALAGCSDSNSTYQPPRIPADGTHVQVSVRSGFTGKLHVGVTDTTINGVRCMVAARAIDCDFPEEP